MNRHSKSARVVVMGSSNTDMVVEVEELPRPGETVLGLRFRTSGGGKGANQAISAARAGGQVFFVGRVGHDAWGDQQLSALRIDGINITYVSRDRQSPSGVALIFVGRKGQNSIAVAGGANGCLRPGDVTRARQAFRAAGVILAQLETPLETVSAAAEEAARAGSIFILNPAPAQTLSRSLLSKVSILTPNESEAEQLTGVRIKDLRTARIAASQLCALGAKAVVMTLGKRGALIADPAGQRRVPGFRVKAVDTVGAGDVFNGALGVALARSEPLDTAVRFANAAAAISVTRRGAQASAPNRAAILRLLRKTVS